MAKKIQKTNLSFDPSSLFENMTEKEKSILLEECSMIFQHSSFRKICDELSTKEILDTINSADTIERLHFGRGKIAGISAVFDTINGYFMEYQQSIKKEDDYDKHSII